MVVTCNPVCTYAITIIRVRCNIYFKNLFYVNTDSVFDKEVGHIQPKNFTPIKSFVIYVLQTTLSAQLKGTFTNYTNTTFHLRRNKKQILNIINAHFYFLKYACCNNARKIGKCRKTWRHHAQSTSHNIKIQTRLRGAHSLVVHSLATANSSHCRKQQQWKNYSPFITPHMPIGIYLQAGHL
jgi:hypothetical protein